jgi:PAS domain S-box-containing protein
LQFLDVKTLSFVALFTSLMLPLVLQAMGALTRQSQATRDWNRGVLFYSLGFVLLATRNVAPDFLSIVVANLILLAGYGELLCGLKHFFGRPVDRRINLTMLLVLVFPLVWFTYGHPSMGQRTFYTSMALLWMSGAIAVELFRAAFATQSDSKASHASERNILLVVGGVFALSGVLMVFRTIFFVEADAEGAFIASQKQLYAFSFLSAILNNFVLASFLPLLVSGRIQRELHASEDLLLQAQAQSGLGTALFDSTQTNITTNAVLPKLLGVPPGQALTREVWRTLIHPEDRTRIAAEVAQLSDEGHLAPRLEYRIIRPDTGEIRWLHNENEIRVHPHKLMRIVMCTVRDITELKEAELSALASKQQADFANQSKGQFLANMSHEIRTPMNAILGMLKLLQNTALNTRQQDYASKSESAAKSLLGLLNDILDFSKVEAGKMTLESEPFRIEQLMRNLGVVLSANAGTKDIEVLFDVDPALPEMVVGDAMRLQQVLVNLGGNAVKFTSTGQVVLSLKELSRTSDTVTIQFAVQDSGIGIAQEHRAHIFSGFSQAEGSTTRRFGGTGLGLAISKSFVELMGDDIEIESTLGVGSTFSFVLTLPIAHENLLEPNAHPRPEVAPLCALVIDDNDVAGNLTLSMVRSLGWDAELASSGAQALEMMRSRLAQAPQIFPYSVIYTDWKMPDMDGWETTHRIHQLAQKYQLPPPKIIMVTAGGRGTLVQRSETEQDLLSGFMVKPVTAFMLYDAFTEATHGKAGVRSVAKGRSSRPQLSGMRILVVEDNLINQQVADELLSAEGAIVSLAANGRLGADAVANAAPQFDVVLMDIQMPVLDGYGATKVIRNELGLKQLPIIAMTANALDSDRAACLDAGMDEHIGKPFDIAKLVSLLIRLTGLQASDDTLAPADVVLTTQALALPQIPGLDVATALARMSGMRSLYVRTAKDFSNILDTVTEELQQSLLGGEIKKSLMLLHTLKGNAGTLGATNLANEAASLERLCKEEHGASGKCLDDLRELEVLIRVTQVQLAQAITGLTPENGPQGTDGDLPASAEELTRILHELASLAKASNMEVLQRFADIRAILYSLPDGFGERMDQALQDLDLATASVLFDDMVVQLSAQLDPL